MHILISRLSSLLTFILTTIKSFFDTIFNKLDKFSILFKAFYLIFTIYILDSFLSPVLSHLVVIRNTITYFLTNTGMIGLITIQFLYLAIGTFIFFLLSRSIIRFFS